jgi:2-amino-4-hydroxy-6-hydroxymethyldihydropteridine diphosphokinase
MSVVSYIALGSNLGDRRAHLEGALDRLRIQPGIVVTKVSRFWETAPVGGPPGQGPFLNAAAELETTLSARELLALCLQIEKEHGRERREPCGPRTLDLDLLFHGQEVIEEPGLTLPHPRLHERPFVLGPLVEIAPNVVHPVLGKAAVELLAGLSARPLQGRRAVVTGSSSGIGRAIALALAARGADVIVHANASRDRGLEVAELARSKGVRSQFLPADVCDREACWRLVDEAWEFLGGIDAWINNAGADTLTGKAATLSFEEKLHLLWAVDVEGTIRLSRAAGERMKRAGHGTIINMGWDQAETGLEGDSGQLFAATKAAVMAFSKSLAVTVAPEVRVNCLAPGWIRTAWGESASEGWQRRAIRETPLGRWGTPEDVARVACWLASPEAEFLTGQIVRVNGGSVR